MQLRSRSGRDAAEPPSAQHALLPCMASSDSHATAHAERFLDQFSTFVLEVLFGSKIGPQGVFWDEKERNRRRKRQRILKIPPKTKQKSRTIFKLKPLRKLESFA